MKLKQLLICAVLAFTPMLSVAHGGAGHGEPLTAKSATVRASQIIVALVNSKKLDVSWQGQPAKESVMRELPKGNVWVVSYRNPAEKDFSKQTLYLFFDEAGNYIGANFNGKLE